MKKILFTLLLFSQSAWGLDGITFDHENWILSCDNTGACRAAGYHQIGDDNLVSVLLTRKAGNNAPIIGKVSFDDLPIENHRLTINGKDLGQVTKKPNNDFSKLTATQTKALLANLKKESAIIFSNDKRTWHLSDKGASAVLLKMDEFQQRIDTPSAIMRKGTSKKSVLKAIPAPIIHAVKTPKDEGKKIKYSDYKPLFKTLEKQLSTREEDGYCNIELLNNGGFTYMLNAETKLLQFDCWQAVYNFARGFALLDNSLKLKKLLPIISGGYHKGEISSSWKDRGLGDCWSNVNYVWTGNDFVLSKEGNTGLCRGFGGGAWELPTFVSTVKYKK